MFKNRSVQMSFVKTPKPDVAVEKSTKESTIEVAEFAIEVLGKTAVALTAAICVLKVVDTVSTVVTHIAETKIK